MVNLRSPPKPCLIILAGQNVHFTTRKTRYFSPVLVRISPDDPPILRWLSSYPMENPNISPVFPAVSLKKKRVPLQQKSSHPHHATSTARSQAGGRTGVGRAPTLRRIKLSDQHCSRSFLEIWSWKRIRSMSSFLPKGFLGAKKKSSEASRI